MAKDTPTKPDDKKTVPAGEEKKNDKAAPGKEPEKVDGKNPDPDNVIPLNKDAAAKEAGTPPKAEPDKKEQTASPEQKAEDKGEPKKEDKKPEPGLSPAEEEKKKGQEALLKELEEKEGLNKKPAPKQKQTREARPPTGVKKEEAPAKEPEPEKTPEPVEAPRPEKTEEVVFIKLSELFPFKDHPFQVRDDAEMRAMVDSVKDKGITQPATVRPREGGGYEMVSGHRRQKASELAGYNDMPCIIKNLTDEQATPCRSSAGIPAGAPGFCAAGSPAPACVRRCR